MFFFFWISEKRFKRLEVLIRVGAMNCLVVVDWCPQLPGSWCHSKGNELWLILRISRYIKHVMQRHPNASLQTMMSSNFDKKQITCPNWSPLDQLPRKQMTKVIRPITIHLFQFWTKRGKTIVSDIGLRKQSLEHHVSWSAPVWRVFYGLIPANSGAPDFGGTFPRRMLISITTLTVSLHPSCSMASILRRPRMNRLLNGYIDGWLWFHIMRIYLVFTFSCL